MCTIQTYNREEYQEDKTTRQSLIEKIKEYVEPESILSEEEKTAYEDKINQKIKMGGKLTQSEMNYIRRTNPVMYAHVLRIQLQREMLLSKLKSCQTKEEVEDVYSMAIAGISKKDPDKQALISAYDNVTSEFKKTNEYKSLPLKEKEEEKRNRDKYQDKSRYRNREKSLEDMLRLADLAESSGNAISYFDIKV